MLRIYLDQADWVRLARATYGRADAERYRDIVDVAHEGVRLGLVSFPLSMAHYFETYNRRDPGSRWRLVRVMGGLSQFRAIAPQNRILPAELDLALRRRFGLPLNPRDCQVFGVGVSHALGEPTLAPKAEWLKRQNSEDAAYFWELFSLAGPMPEIEGSDGVEMESYKTPSQEFRGVEERLAEAFRRERFRHDRRKDMLAANELIDIIDQVREAMERAGVPEGRLFVRGKDGLTQFLEDIPTRNVALKLRQLRHDNPQERWSRTDLGDMAALTVAVPYCDVVVTEKRWVHRVGRAGLDEQYSTKMLSDPAQLLDLLVTATSAA